MTIKNHGNKTIVNYERLQEINNRLDVIAESDTPEEVALMAELRELFVDHSNTVPAAVYDTDIYYNEIIPAQMKYIEENAGIKASSLMSPLRMIARRIVREK